MTSRQIAESIMSDYVLDPVVCDDLVLAVSNAVEDARKEGMRFKWRSLESRKMVRDIVTTRDGEHSTKRTVMIEVQIIWPEEKPLSVHETVGSWVVVE
jgi:hypothetical protein